MGCGGSPELLPSLNANWRMLFASASSRLFSLGSVLFTRRD
jgi:hypothetical protein